MSKRKNQEPKNEGEIKETKEQKFFRITPKRVTKCLNALRLIQNIFASKGYSMTEEQMTKIVSKLENEVLKIKTIFDSRSKGNTKETFEL